ncbi:MAG: DUF5658 family protein [Pseudomonadota bacterium]
MKCSAARSGDEVFFAALLLVVVLSIVDYYLTLFIISSGGMEINPLLAPVITSDPMACYFLKFALTAGGVAVLGGLVHIRLARVAIPLILATHVALVVYETTLMNGFLVG